MLDDREPRTLMLENLDGAEGLLYLGRGDAAVEVLVVPLRARPRPAQLREAWIHRKGGRPAPLLLVATQGETCAICATHAGEPRVEADLRTDQIEKLCRAVLELPNRHAVLRLLASALPDIRSETPGLRNQGLFATHELRRGVPVRKDWASAQERSKPLVGLRGRRLVEALGYTVRDTAGPASILATRQGAQVAVAVFLDESEAVEIASPRFSGLSPILHALAAADQAQVAYVVSSAGSCLRLYATTPGAGVGQRGRTETFTELRLDLIKSDQVGYLALLFSPEALSRAGSVAEILDSSRRYAAELGRRLRERIYDDVVPRLGEAILKAMRVRTPSADDLGEAYRAALCILFRLLFLAYAEDRDLLPFGSNDAYRRRALKTRALELAGHVAEGESGAEALWPEVKLLFTAVNHGKRDWGIPTYDGGLFSDDPQVSEIGARISELDLPEPSFRAALEALLIEETDEGRGPVDFRSLSVREFGTIYEGLLEHNLNLAGEDLAIDQAGIYRPAKAKDSVKVRAGSAYLVTSSGERKASGSYYTKSFAVEHLLDHSLEPALTDHRARLDGMTEKEAGAAFFDFKVADIAMGSGHFLVAAVDRIERALSNYLTKRSLKPVREELDRLRDRARENLGPMADAADIDDAKLLRRQIARRCIYGVDLAPNAVDLARLSLWVHTFVPGLPLSVLDRNIVPGDSLVGIGTQEEARVIADEHGLPLFGPALRKMMNVAFEAVGKLARLSDADSAEIKQARKEMANAREAVKPAEAFFDLLSASRLDPSLALALTEATEIWEDKPATLYGSKPHKKAIEAFGRLRPFHFPLSFPEVFLRERSGFDVIIGNPPWEEATLEEDDFWSRWEPGYQGLPQREREKLRQSYRRKWPERVQMFEAERQKAETLRKALVTGPFRGMGTGDPDTYKAFCWRFWDLMAKPGGRIGVVLPRSAMHASGSSEWRRTVFSEGQIHDLTFLDNKDAWVFDGVHAQTAVALVGVQAAAATVETSEASRSLLPIRGPYLSHADYCEGMNRKPHHLEVADILTRTDTASIPLLPTEDSIEIWAKMRQAPRLDSRRVGEWRARPYTELHATNEKNVMKFTDSPPEGYWPVFKGESFDIWECDRGPDTYYAWVNPEKIQKYLQEKRLRARKQDSPFSEFNCAWLRDPATLPCLHPRICYRDVTNWRNRRTVIASLVPANVAVTNSAPFLLWSLGDEKDQAYFLGVLCSIPLDWYARRVVEKHVSFFVFNPFPIPRPWRDDRRWQRVVELAGRLAAQDKRFRAWAKKVGVEWGALNMDTKNDMIAELDAVVAQLYELTEKQLKHVFETFHEGWDYADRLDRVLLHFAKWGKRG